MPRYCAFRSPQFLSLFSCTRFFSHWSHRAYRKGICSPIDAGVLVIPVQYSSRSRKFQLNRSNWRLSNEYKTGCEAVNSSATSVIDFPFQNGLIILQREKQRIELNLSTFFSLFNDFPSFRDCEARQINFVFESTFISISLENTLGGEYLTSAACFRRGRISIAS